MNKDEIFDFLQERIIDLEYKPGDILNEQELCSEFKVSRTPVREVLIQLAEMDLVTIKPKVGTYVAEIDTRKLKYLYEIKTPLEGLVAELAALRSSEEDIRRLESIVQQLRSFEEKAKNVRKPVDYYHEKDMEFHRICREATRNEFLVKFLDELHMKSKRFLHHINYETLELDWYTDTLEEILESIRQKNPERAKNAAILHNQVFIRKLSEYFFGQEFDI